MLVESVDGQRALLGRPRSLARRGPVLTCLSGFIEQGESIEEAVRHILLRFQLRPLVSCIFIHSYSEKLPLHCGRGSLCKNS